MTVALAVDVEEIAEVLEDWLRGLRLASDKEAYLIGQFEAAFDEHFEPIDLPGPDLLLDAALRSMIAPSTHMLCVILQKMAEKKRAQKEAAEGD